MKYYVVDAFADAVFTGNPAGVCLPDSWPADSLMQSIAAENNLSETAFAVAQNGRYGLRWFTPGGEIDLCGHATLATAHAIASFRDTGAAALEFETKSGLLTVVNNNGLYEMDFPAYSLRQAAVTDEMAQAIGFRPIEAWLGRDLVCVLEDEGQIARATPDMQRVLGLEGLLLHITAKGREYDCISRSFAPKLRVDEDPVCGSGHCHIAPLWAKRLGKESLVARQASRRGGTLYCRVQGGRVQLAGRAALYSVGQLMV